VKLNPPLETAKTVRLTSVDNTVTFNDGTADFDITFDDSGRLNLADGVTTINIEAVGGGGSADGQGYEIIRHNNTAVDAETDGGVLDFEDTSNSGTTLGVTWSLTGGQEAVAASGDNLRTEITATVDASGLTPGDIGAPGQVDALVRIADGAASSTITLSSENFSGRAIEFRIYVHGSDFTQAQWDAYTASADSANFSSLKGWRIRVNRCIALRSRWIKPKTFTLMLTTDTN